MHHNNAEKAIAEGKVSLGIELGSTRIKAVLIGEDFLPIASGSHDWENRLEDGVWTYRLEDVWAGLQACYGELAAKVREVYGVPLTAVGSIGISAMMHGYLPFDAEGRQLAPFRTWRNTITERASNVLTDEFGFHIPQRWSIAHLYQAILNGESHVGEIDFLTTLSGYVHWKLTGERVLGVGEASGMFPIDGMDYDGKMLSKFDALVADKGFSWQLQKILPRVLNAGEPAGVLTQEGARLLDPSGSLRPGIPLCPPEGDAGTGMVATNSVAPRTGNISAGTSIFAMIVLEKAFSQAYPEIDIVATPGGSPVAMVHCNNCTTDLDAWVKLLGESAALFGVKPTKAALYDALYYAALEGEADGGGLVAYNYFSGEHITGFEQGRPLLARTPESRFTLANLMRTLLFSTMATLKIGMEILTEREHAAPRQLMGHGGLFKTPGVGQRLMAGALGVPVAVMDSAGEGGAWGIALLAAYMLVKREGEALEAFLAERVFSGQTCSSAEPEAEITQGFSAFMERYRAGLAIERAAVEQLR